MSLESSSSNSSENNKQTVGSSALALAVFMILGIALLAPASRANDAGATSQMQYAVQKASNSNIRAGFVAFNTDNYAKSASLTKAALKSGLSSKRKSVAYSNLCAAYGAMGNAADALAACNEAVPLNARNWRAMNNRAVVNYSAGNVTEARADLQAAASLKGADIVLITANKALAGNTKIAAKQ